MSVSDMVEPVCGPEMNDAYDTCQLPLLLPPEKQASKPRNQKLEMPQFSLSSYIDST